MLIEATIVEVELDDRYNAGIDWRKVVSALSDGVSFTVGAVTGSPLLPVASSFFNLNYSDGTSAGVDATLSALSEFGNVRVLSSPKLMVLNNQTSVLKVVDNFVYFTTDVETTVNQNTTLTTVDTNLNTVPIGLVMSVTPQISQNDAVIVNVRPTVTRISEFINDPNPELRRAGATSRIPVVQTREMESMLRVNSGQTAVLGGLMQDDSSATTQGVPVLENLFPIGEALKHRDNVYSKSELVIFLRPTVIKNASLNADLQNFREFLTPEFDPRVAAPGENPFPPQPAQ